MVDPRELDSNYENVRRPSVLSRASPVIFNPKEHLAATKFSVPPSYSTRPRLDKPVNHVNPRFFPISNRYLLARHNARKNLPCCEDFRARSIVKSAIPVADPRRMHVHADSREKVIAGRETFKSAMSLRDWNWPGVRANAHSPRLIYNSSGIARVSRSRSRFCCTLRFGSGNL